MWSTYLLIFLMLCIGAAGWLVFIWAVKSGQYDDVEGPKYRMLDDEEEGPPPAPGGNRPVCTQPTPGKDADRAAH
jgi:cbb3-type cytochrome oxidase maturation protein